MTVLSTVTRTARRPGVGHTWQCSWCWQRIVAGEKYEDQTQVNDGEIERVRTHPECSDACSAADLGDDEPITEAQPRGMTQSEAMDARRRAGVDT